MVVSSATLPLNLQPISVRTTSASLIFRPVKRMLARQPIYETCCFKCERNVDSYVNTLIQNFPINPYTICTILSPLFQPLHFSFLFFLNKKFNNPKLIRNVDLDIDRESVRRVSRLFVRLLFQFPRD